MRVDNSTGKCVPGMDKFGSLVNRLRMELESKFINSLKIKTKVLERF